MDTPYNNLTNTIGVGDVVPAGSGHCGNTVFDNPKNKKKPATKKQAPQPFDHSNQLPTIVYIKK